MDNLQNFPRWMVVLALLLPGLAPFSPDAVSAAPPVAQTTLAAPLLKWQHGGCFSSWCETGWYSSPAAADLDGDGTIEVVASAYSVVVLDGATGSLEWRAASGHARSETGASNVGRTWPGMVLADVDADGTLEIISAHSGGYVSVYRADGSFKPGWPQRPTTNELRGLSVEDLDGDGALEVIVTGALGSKLNTWVFSATGQIRPGWPQLANDSGYGWGVYNANAAVADLDGDGRGEIVVPSDVHYINAYQDDGTQIAAHARFGGKGWGKVGIWEDPAIELRGWGACDGQRAESYRVNYAHGPAAVADVNADGIPEVIVTGNMYDCHTDPYTSKYTSLHIFNADRSRFQAGAWDWTTTPLDTGAPLSEDYNVIESAQPNPVPADLDGDGVLEVLFASYDGRLHAFWLDKTEHGSWPFEVAQPGVMRFASEPAVADLDGDGQAEVLFTTWTQKSSGETGKLVIVSAQGTLLFEVPLPALRNGSSGSGALPAPTLAQLDSDPDLEVIVNTTGAGFAAYDLPGTANARILWGTGRGNQRRTGTAVASLRLTPSLSITPATPAPDEPLHITLDLRSTSTWPASAQAEITLSVGMEYAGALAASNGTVQFDGEKVLWSGTLDHTHPVQISFQATLQPDAPAVVSASALVTAEGTSDTNASAKAFINGSQVFLPIARR